MFFSQPDRYISLLTDFGFKRIFGSEPNKRLLIDFLNTLLPDYHQIREVTFKNSENLGQTTFDRRAIFDIYCESENGDFFIVELQKAKQNCFKDRSVYYASFPIQEQAEKGEWSYELTAVYTVGVLDFIFDDHKHDPDIVHVVKLKDQHCQVFYDKLTFIYIELPKFKKTLEQLETHFDRWLFLLRHLAKLDEPPPLLQNEAVFSELFEAARIANFSPQEQLSYQASLKVFRDWYAIEMTARQEAMTQGLQQGLEQGLEQGLQQGLEQGLQQGLEQGLQQGLERGRKTEAIALITRQLTRRFRQNLSEETRAALSKLSLSALEVLSEALIDFTSLADLNNWLAQVKEGEPLE